MALAGPSGAESPSAAFLAGKQHGTKLAIQHATPGTIVHSVHKADGTIIDQGINPNYKPGTKTASPTRKPAATQTTPGTLTLDDLLAQAKALAAQDTTAQVGAIKAQQDTYTKQAADRASQVNLASQAAAKLLQGFGLADNTASSYNNGAQILAGLAQGYSGDLRNTATDAASQIQAQLASLGAPADSLKTSTGETSNPQALGNVLYGLGGAIPANLLVTSGLAAAAAQRGLPASTLAFGQQQAAGTLAAGQTQADTLNPQIAAAMSGLPAATRQYLSALLSAQDQQFNQGLATAKFGLDQSKFTLAQKVEAFNQQYKVDTLNLKGQSLQLQGNKFARSVLQSDRSYQIALAGLGLRTEASQRAALKDEYKLANGGYDVKTVGKLTGDASAIAQDAFNGFTDAKTNKVYPPLNFGQALTEMRKGSRNGAVPLSIALKAMKQAGYTVPARYDKLMGGLGQGADPFGSPRGLSSVKVAPGANRPGVPLSPVVESFVSALARRIGSPLTIGTGSNHKEITQDGLESDHWTGNAADIPASGAALIRLGQQALILAGKDPAWALRQTRGGLYNVQTPEGRIQIIFGNYPGHANHLHVGVRP